MAPEEYIANKLDLARRYPQKKSFLEKNDVGAEDKSTLISQKKLRICEYR
jgi:hypothetical protein